MLLVISLYVISVTNNNVHYGYEIHLVLCHFLWKKNQDPTEINGKFFHVFLVSCTLSMIPNDAAV